MIDESGSMAPIVPSGVGGRDGRGRFVRGNPGGTGNPHAARVARFRELLVGSVSDDELRDVVATLVQRARAGEPWAVRELLDRTMGRVSQVAAEDGPGLAGPILRVVIE